MASNQNFRKQHFSLKDRLVSLVSEGLFRDFTYTVRHGLIKGMKRKGGLGFLPAFLRRSSSNTPEEVFLQGLNLKGKVVYDVGAFQGIMTLFFAQKARAVISYEPHPSNCRRFGENVALNRLNHVTVLNRAVGNKESTLRLVCDPRMPGAASGDAGISAQISGSVAQASTMEVPMVRLDDDIERNHLPLPDFIKIDIEGMELAALEGMTETLSKHRPALYLEMHGVSEEEKEEKAARIVRFLHSMGYTHIRHVETGTVINASNVAVARAGHLYCTTVP